MRLDAFADVHYDTQPEIHVVLSKLPAWCGMISLSRSIILFAFVAVFAGSSIVPTCADEKGLMSRIVDDLLSKANIPTSGLSVLLTLVLDPPPVSPKPKYELDLTQSNPQLASKTGAELGDDVSNLERAIEFAKTLPRSVDNENAITTMLKMRNVAKAEIEQRQKENIPPTYSIDQLQAVRNDLMQEAARRHYPVPLPEPLPHPAPNPGPEPAPIPQPPPVEKGNCTQTSPNSGECTTTVVH
jgi:hypothetical protein